jgi:hypothetical protein
MESSKIFVCAYNSLLMIGTTIERWNLDSARDNRDDETFVVKNSGNTTIIIDFAVFDEAHKMEGLTKISDINPIGFMYGLYDSNIDIQNRLFMTGTTP